MRKKMKKLFLFMFLFFINSCIVEQVEQKYTIQRFGKEECENENTQITNFIDISLDALYYEQVLISELHFKFNNDSKHELSFDSTSIEYECNLYEYEIFSVSPKNFILSDGKEGELHFVLIGTKNDVRYTNPISKEVIMIKLYGHLEGKERILLYCAKLAS